MSLNTINIAQSVTQQVSQWCQCQYPGSFITNSQLFCTTNNDVIYQALLLPTDSKTALEIRNIIQLWVLSNPTIMLDGKSYHLYSNCSVVVKELGVTSCGVVRHNVSLPNSEIPVSTIELVSVVGTAVLLLLVIALVITVVITSCVRLRKSSFNMRY